MRKISVILATYNGESYLREQLDSILQQTIPVSEIIVSDDNSTDGTVHILKEYEQKGAIKWKFNSNEKGVIGNFKSAAELVDIENYIAFSDQDDIWYPEKLEKSFERVSETQDDSKPSMVYSDPQIINAQGSLIGGSLWDVLGYNNYIHHLSTVIFGNPAGGLTMLINPVLAKQIKNIPNSAYMHDAWLTLYAFSFGEAKVVKGSLVKYRQHDNNLTFSTAYQPQSRFRRVLNELKSVVAGQDNLFADQFPFVKQFYAFYKDQLSLENQLVFLNFLALEHKGYLFKKLAFRKAMKNATRN